MLLLVTSTILFCCVITGIVRGGQLEGKVRRVTIKGVDCRVPVSKLRKRGGGVTLVVGKVKAKLGGTITRTVGGRHLGASLVAGISRSVGAPLASVLGCINVLERASPTSPGIRSCLGVLRRGTRELGALARSMMRTSGIDDKGVSLRCVSLSLSRVVRRARNRLRRGFRTEGLTVIASLPTRPTIIRISNEEV